jgi:hypothetical protein
MRDSRRAAQSMAVVVLGTVLALCSSPTASARVVHEIGGHVTPAAHGGRLLGEQIAAIAALPASDQGPDCELLAGGKVLAPHASGCTVRPGMTVSLRTFWNECSNVEPPFSSDAAVQRNCAAEFDRATIKALRVRINQGTTTDIRTRRFEVFSPQMVVQLPADNIFGVNPQTINFSVHGWVATVKGLVPGANTVRIELVFADGETFVNSLVITKTRDDDRQDG